MNTLKMILSALGHLFRLLGPLGIATCAIALAAYFWFFNPLGSIGESIKGAFEKKVEGTTSVTFDGFRKLQRLKVLKCYVGGFLNRDVSLKNEKGELERAASIVYQWEGYGELVVDLAPEHCQVETATSPEGVSHITVTLSAPKLDPETSRSLVIPERYQDDWNALGQAEIKTRLWAGIDKYVAQEIVSAITTNKANFVRAKAQAEKILRCVLAPGVQSPDRDIVFVWKD